MRIEVEPKHYAKAAALLVVFFALANLPSEERGCGALALIFLIVAPFAFAALCGAPLSLAVDMRGFITAG